MRKSIITLGSQAVETKDEWLDLDLFASVEVTSEDREHSIESALIPNRGSGWLADASGPQTIRLRFDKPQRIRRIWLNFAEHDEARTQEFVLRWGTVDDKQPAREIVRQQWTFSPGGSTQETEDYRVDLCGVMVLELAIRPNISGGETRASLVEMRLA
jgi:hypothetical protein